MARQQAPAEQPVQDPADLAAVVAVLATVVCRVVCQVAPGRAPATFRQIATTQLRVASDAEVDVIEAFLAGHGG
jgi:hypothetical protein